jgi:hypothetical protein
MKSWESRGYSKKHSSPSCRGQSQPSTDSERESEHLFWSTAGKKRKSKLVLLLPPGHDVARALCCWERGMQTYLQNLAWGPMQGTVFLLQSWSGWTCPFFFKLTKKNYREGRGAKERKHTHTHKPEETLFLTLRFQEAQWSNHFPSKFLLVN